MSQHSLETRQWGLQLPTTRWTLLDALGAGDEARTQALEALCAAYWEPIYAFIRMKGRLPEDAEDLTQEFLVSMIERESFDQISADKGRLRSFLLRSVQNFLSVDHRARTRLKRGRQYTHISLEQDVGAVGFDCLAGTTPSPETVFERRWALCVLDRALARLAESYQKENRRSYFDVLAPMIAGTGERLNFAQAGEAIGISEGAARVAAFRLRKRLRQFVHEEIARTVAGDPRDVEAEIRHLFTAFQSAAQPLP